MTATISVMRTVREFRRAGRRWSDLSARSGLTCATCVETIKHSDHIEVRTLHTQTRPAERYVVYHWACRPDAVDRQMAVLRRRVEGGRHWLHF